MHTCLQASIVGLVRRHFFASQVLRPIATCFALLLRHSISTLKSAHGSVTSQNFGLLMGGDWAFAAKAGEAAIRSARVSYTVLRDL